jgi:hypothetical protein
VPGANEVGAKLGKVPYTHEMHDTESVGRACNSLREFLLGNVMLDYWIVMRVEVTRK